MTLGELRSRFWVPKGRQVGKRILKECETCKRERHEPFREPSTAALLDFRVKEAPPFSKVGIGFAGPLFFKSHTGEMVKSYVVLFTCCNTREVHLDLVTNLSVTTFVRCLRKFAARRGTLSLIMSDNAKTFKGTAKLLKTMRDLKEVKEHLQGNRIDWKFNL